MEMNHIPKTSIKMDYTVVYMTNFDNTMRQWSNKVFIMK